MAFPGEANVLVCTLRLNCNIHSGSGSTLIIKSFCTTFSFLGRAGGWAGTLTAGLAGLERRLGGLDPSAGPCTPAWGPEVPIRIN